MWNCWSLVSGFTDVSALKILISLDPLASLLLCLSIPYFRRLAERYAEFFSFILTLFLYRRLQYTLTLIPPSRFCMKETLRLLPVRRFEREDEVHLRLRYLAAGGCCGKNGWWVVGGGSACKERLSFLPQNLLHRNESLSN